MYSIMCFMTIKRAFGLFSWLLINMFFFYASILSILPRALVEQFKSLS